MHQQVQYYDKGFDHSGQAIRKPQLYGKIGPKSNFHFLLFSHEDEEDAEPYLRNFMV